MRENKSNEIHLQLKCTLYVLQNRSTIQYFIKLLRWHLVVVNLKRHMVHFSLVCDFPSSYCFLS